MSITERIQRFKGCRYPNTLPDGRTARVLWGKRIEGPSGPVPFPPGASAFDCLRIGPTGHIAGTANVGGQDYAFFWDGAWHGMGIAPGRNAVAWGPTGDLYIVRSGTTVDRYRPTGTYVERNIPAPVGSMGIRFIAWDDRIVLTASSYQDNGTGVLERTDRGDCAIGQGAKPDQGVVVRFKDDGVLRRFHLGADRDVRWEWTGNQIAVSWTAQTTNEACIWTGTLDELRTLPPVNPEPIPPEPPPVPPVPPVPWAGNDTLVSDDGRFWLQLQNDGNPVVHGPDGSVYGLGRVWPWETPEPQPPGPVPQHPQIGASYYTSLTDPRVNVREFADRLQQAGCSQTRVWLIDAWAVGPTGPGQYGGFVPWLRDADGVFDLDAVDPHYLARIHEYVEVMNAAGITPTLTGWELYSWSHAKAGMLWVPDANLGPLRNNRQGIRYGQGRVGTFDGVKFANPDDEALIVDIASSRGPHAFLDQLCNAVVTTLRGMRWKPEAGNEMPEKGLNYRLRALWRAAGYVGDVQVNRNTDTPGQWANMRIGQADGFERIAYHGKRDMAYLDVEYPDEAPAGRPTTFRAFYATKPDPARITLSSDGCRKSINVEDAYDYPALTEVCLDARDRGFDLDHQLALKLRSFRDGRIDLNDMQYDAALLAALQR